jgi:hypothetical protein
MRLRAGPQYVLDPIGDVAQFGKYAAQLGVAIYRIERLVR